MAVIARKSSTGGIVKEAAEKKQQWWQRKMDRAANVTQSGSSKACLVKLGKYMSQGSTGKGKVGWRVPALAAAAAAAGITAGAGESAQG